MYRVRAYWAMNPSGRGRAEQDIAADQRTNAGRGLYFADAHA